MNDALFVVIRDAAATVGATTVLYIALSKAFTGLRGVIPALDRFAESRTERRKNDRKTADGIAQLLKILTPNGGSSIDDRIKRIEKLLGDDGAIIGELRAIRTEFRVMGLGISTMWEHWEIPSYRCDKDGFCTDANSALLKMFGLTKHEMLGTGWTRVFPDADTQQSAWGNWINAIKLKIPYHDEYEIKNAQTGEIIRVSTFARASLHPVTGEPEGFIGLVRDTHRVSKNGGAA